MPENYDFDAAIMQRNHACNITLFHLVSNSQLQRLVRVTQGPFPALVHFFLQFDRSNGHAAPPLPDGFLGGSSPRLQFLALNSVRFPALPKPFLSGTDLVHLALERIPHNGSHPRRTSLSWPCWQTSNFSRLNSSPFNLALTGNPDVRLCWHTLFYLLLLSEYLEDLVARIDAPLLGTVCITFFYQLIFDTPRHSS
jgi:hypothetical protein